MHFNVLSFRCSSHISLYTIYDASKSLCATATQESVFDLAFDASILIKVSLTQKCSYSLILK